MKKKKNGVDDTGRADKNRCDRREARDLFEILRWAHKERSAFDSGQMPGQMFVSTYTRV